MKRRHFLLGSLTFLLTTGLAAKGYAMFGFDNKDTHSATDNFPFKLTDTEWRQRLSPSAYDVLRHHGTERSGTSELDKNYAKGNYHCAGCDQILFISDHKFDSGTGWPSFYQPFDGVQSKSIGTREDNKLWMKRVEVHCTNCGGHQGHVFPDGPKPTGLRYCVNGVALKFKPT